MVDGDGGGNNENYFIYLNSRRQKIKVFLTFMFILFILVALGVAFLTVFYNAIQDARVIKAFSSLVKNEIIQLTPIGVFYAHLFGGLFFLPSPDEIIFYLSLVKGNPILLTFFMANAGFYLAQIINYFLGFKFSNIIIHLVSKRKMFKSRRFVNKYGSLGVFLFNFLPLPAPVLTFALGIIKYNIYRLFFFTILGKVAKYGIIVMFFLLVNGRLF